MSESLPEQDKLLSIYDQSRCEAFSSQELPSDHIALVLEAGRFSDSPGNLQPWRFIVIHDQEMRNKIAQLCYGQDFISRAPISVVIVSDEEQAIRFYQRAGSRYNTQYAAMLTQNMASAARILGYGANLTFAFDPDLADLLKVPDSWRIQSVMAFGIPLHEPLYEDRTSIRNLVYLETWGRQIEHLDYVTHDVPIVQYLGERAKQLLRPLGSVIKGFAGRARFERLHADLEVKNRQIESLREDLRGLHERKDAPWSYVVMKASKGLEFPATHEYLLERFEGLSLNQEPIQDILDRISYPVVNRRELLSKIKEAIKR